MYMNKAKVVCIDNWSLFSGPKELFLHNFNKYKGENDATFIETDCFNYDILYHFYLNLIYICMMVVINMIVIIKH